MRKKNYFSSKEHTTGKDKYLDREIQFPLLMQSFTRVYLEEDGPGREIVREIYKPVLDPGRNEKGITRLERVSMALYHQFS